MRQLWGIATATLLVLGALGGGTKGAHAQDQAMSQQQERAGTTAQQAAAPTALMSRLHQAALREIQLGEAAQGGGGHRDTRAYGAQLAADFRAFDKRVITFAAANGIEQEQLDNVHPGENVVALQRQVDDLARLANERGERFDRDYWVAIAQEQAATSDMLPSVMVTDPALSTIVSDLGALLDRSSRRALGSAEATEREAPTPATPPPPASLPSP